MTTLRHVKIGMSLPPLANWISSDPSKFVYAGSSPAGGANGIFLRFHIISFRFLRFQIWRLSGIFFGTLVRLVPLGSF